MANINTQLVHENEVQRRHARIRIPLKLFLTTEDGTSKKFSVHDISVSGFAIKTSSEALRENVLYSGELQFNLNNEKFLIPVNFTVLYCNLEEKKAGCAFEQLDKEGLSILQLFISKYLCGELVTNEDILTTLSRDNFTKARATGKDKPHSTWQKMRTVTGTVLAACLGICAITFIAVNIYHHLFVTQDIMAMVDIDAEVIASPVNGNVKILMENNQKIVKGRPIAGISSPVTDYITDINTKLANGESLESLLPKQVHRVITSPFNGTIIISKALNDTYVEKGDSLFTVIKDGNEPFIRAVFKYADADELTIGKKVTLQFPGNTERLAGVITDINVDVKKSSTELFAIIRPDTTLPFDTIQKPVHVLISPLSNNSSLLSATSHLGSVLAKAW